MLKLKIKERILYPCLKMGHRALIFGYRLPLHRLYVTENTLTYGMGNGVAIK